MRKEIKEMKNGITKIAGIVCNICLMFLLIGCGENAKVIEGEIQNNVKTEVGDVQENPGEDQQNYKEMSIETDKKHKGYLFIYQGVEIEIDAVAGPILEQLGEANSYFEAPSCAFDGIDKMYTYNSFELDTYPVDDVDYVSSILFKDDAIATAEGVGIGDTQEKLVEAYGGDYGNENGMIVYEKDGMKLCFIVEDEMISSIEYRTTILDE